MAVEKEKSASERPPSPALRFVARKKASSKASSTPIDKPITEQVDSDLKLKSSGPSKNEKQSKVQQPTDASKTYSPRLKFHSELRLDYQNQLEEICSSRKKERISPWTKVDILEEAMAFWLEKNKL